MTGSKEDTNLRMSSSIAGLIFAWPPCEWMPFPIKRTSLVKALPWYIEMVGRTNDEMNLRVAPTLRRENRLVGVFDGLLDE